MDHNINVNGQTYQVDDQQGCFTIATLSHARATACMAMHIKHGPKHDDKRCIGIFCTALAQVRGNRPPTVPITLDDARRVMLLVNQNVVELLETQTPQETNDASFN